MMNDLSYFFDIKQFFLRRKSKSEVQVQ